MNIVWLKTGPLHPLDTGGKIRTYNMLRILSARHRVTYLSLLPDSSSADVTRAGAEYAAEHVWVPWSEIRKGSVSFCSGVLLNAVAGRLPYVVRKYTSSRMIRLLRELPAARTANLLVCDFLAPSENVLRALPLAMPTVLFQHNVETRIWDRLADNAANPATRLYFWQQARRMRRYEAAAGAHFDGVITVSPDDTRLLREELGLTNVLGDVPTGVDVERFAPAVSASPPQPGHIVFLGSMDWMPNIDAVDDFVARVYPRIRAAVPTATLSIVGRNPPARIRALRQRGLAIDVTGTVDDVRPYLHRAAVNIVPLRVGGGTRIKIYEAMAAGVPVVSTGIGAEGLPVTHGRDILLADTAEAFADAVVRLLEDEDRRRALADAGRELVAARFGWDKAVDRFETLCARAVSARG